MWWAVISTIYVIGLFIYTYICMNIYDKKAENTGQEELEELITAIAQANEINEINIMDEINRMNRRTSSFVEKINEVNINGFER